jgi:HK97 family phage major capsid protein
MEAFSEEFNFAVEDSIVNGLGGGQLLGFSKAPCLVTVAKETGQASQTIVYENLVKMWSRMWGRSRPNSVWLIKQDIEPQLYTMGLTIGTGGAPVYLPPGGASQSPFATLFGRPVIEIEYANTLGQVGDIMLVDLSQYLMIDKGPMQSASSIHVRFLNDETTFRFIYRCDGKPLWNVAVTPNKGTNTLSPFVTLAAR